LRKSIKKSASAVFMSLKILICHIHLQTYSSRICLERRWKHASNLHAIKMIKMSKKNELLNYMLASQWMWGIQKFLSQNRESPFFFFVAMQPHYPFYKIILSPALSVIKDLLKIMIYSSGVFFPPQSVREQTEHLTH